MPWGDEQTWILATFAGSWQGTRAFTHTQPWSRINYNDCLRVWFHLQGRYLVLWGPIFQLMRSFYLIFILISIDNPNCSPSMAGAGITAGDAWSLYSIEPHLITTWSQSCSPTSSRNPPWFRFSLGGMYQIKRHVHVHQPPYQKSAAIPWNSPYFSEKNSVKPSMFLCFSNFPMVFPWFSHGFPIFLCFSKMTKTGSLPGMKKKPSSLASPAARRLPWSALHLTTEQHHAAMSREVSKIPSFSWLV